MTFIGSAFQLERSLTEDDVYLFAGYKRLWRYWKACLRILRPEDALMNSGSDILQTQSETVFMVFTESRTAACLNTVFIYQVDFSSSLFDLRLPILIGTISRGYRGKFHLGDQSYVMRGPCSVRAHGKFIREKHFKFGKQGTIVYSIY